MAVASAGTPALAQTSTAEATVPLTAAYDVRPNVPYHPAGGTRVLDAYVPFAPDTEGRAVVYVHGGGWVWDTKERNALELLPFLARGWTVLSVEYRRADEAPAPAAVADVRCAASAACVARSNCSSRDSPAFARNPTGRSCFAARNPLLLDDAMNGQRQEVVAAHAIYYICDSQNNISSEHSCSQTRWLQW